MSVEPTEAHVGSLPSDLPSAPLPPPSNLWRLTGFRVTLIVLFLVVLGFVIAVWHSSREVDQFIKLHAAMVEATCDQAELANHYHEASAAHLLEQCREGRLTSERYAKDSVEAAMDMEIAKNKGLFKQSVEGKPK